MSGGSARPPSGRWRRRGRLWLAAGGALFALVAIALVALRPAPVPYTAGSEAATSDEITRRLDRALPAGAPRVTFAEAAASAGIRFRHFDGPRSTQLPEDMGSGAAWGDYDGDGDPDLYLVNESGALNRSAEEAARSPARSALFRNQGDGTFVAVTEEARANVSGLGMAAAWGDVDEDGDLDLVVTRFGRNVLLGNDGDGRFTDRSLESGVGEAEGFWTGAAFADYDRDGRLDLYVCGYVRYHPGAAEAGRSSPQYNAVVPFTLNPSSFPPERNLLLHNQGRGRFRETAREAGVDNPSGRSLSAAWADFDGDLWPDIYVANDISDNAMFRNRGDGTFEDVSHAAWVADYRGAMGLGIGDWDNDEDLDIFVTHWIAQENALYDSLKETFPPSPPPPMRFVDQADMVGLGQIALDFVGWGTDFLDYDNDGRLDLFVVNGSTFQGADDPTWLVPMRNHLFWNGGEREGYFEVGPIAGESFAVENVGRGAAFADYDRDGDVDVLVVVNGGDARLLRNDGGSDKAWLRVVLRGPAAAKGRAARGLATTTFATGARLRLVARGQVQVREVGGSPSYLSQAPPGEAHFGLGEAAAAERLEVLWPDGQRQTMENVPARSTVLLTEGEEPVIVPSGAPR